MKQIEAAEKGTIFNIQRFSLHDGPGVRTTIFFKGCSLRCIWCQNPEGIMAHKQLLRHPQRCLACYLCRSLCPEKAIIIDNDGVLTVDRFACRSCFSCAVNCPAEALEIAGREISVDELVEEALKDLVLYEQSGGGVTISGGEPFLQGPFLLTLLKALKAKGIHTAVDTCGYAEPGIVLAAVKCADLFLFDIKFADERLSLEYTGKPNDLILKNLELLSINKSAVRVRMPVIPGINDHRNNIEAIGRFLNKFGFDSLELIPYHQFGVVKYTRLGLDYKLDGLTAPSDEKMENIKSIFNEMGLKIIEEGD